jgi:hypothetical protein
LSDNDADDFYDFDDAVPHPGIPLTLADLTSTYDWHASPDVALQRMADWAERVKQGISLTLITEGGLISGVVIPPQDFYRGASEEFMKIIADNEGPDHEEFARQFVDIHFAERARYIDRDLAKEEEALKFGDAPATDYVDRLIMTRYIHLKGAYYHAPNQTSITLGFTRVLLSKVSAWSVGHPVFP